MTISAELIESMGTDLTVCNAARVSFSKESDWENAAWGHVDFEEPNYLSEKDVKLLNYLASHGHWTPYSHPQIMIRETVPIFVARQRFKHMVGFTYNEVSRRYVDDTPEFYTPDVWRGKPINAKQGSSEEIVETLWYHVDSPIPVTEAVQRFYREAEGLYEEMLKSGIAPEQARMVLPQSMLTSYYVTGSLAAWARAYKQRIDPHAQKEIQDLAIQWGNIIQPLFPVSWAALTKVEKE